MDTNGIPCPIIPVLVDHLEPNNEICNSVCRLSIDGDNEELVLGGISSLSLSTPDRAAQYCKWRSGDDMNTLIVQVTNRETLLPK